MIVTISNQYGCGALAIARSVAEKLRYALVDEQLPVVVAKRLRTSPEAVDAAEDSVRNLGERMMTGLERATPEVVMSAPAENFDEDCFREVQQAVREYAARGNAVIFGRGANLILGRREDVLRVFMHAPKEWRIGHVSASIGVALNDAAAEIERIDRARKGYVRERYGADWGVPENYDLSLDVARLGAERCAQLIVTAAGG